MYMKESILPSVSDEIFLLYQCGKLLKHFKGRNIKKILVIDFFFLFALYHVGRWRVDTLYTKRPVSYISNSDKLLLKSNYSIYYFSFLFPLYFRISFR